jgi:hypothetical protein
MGATSTADLDSQALITAKYSNRRALMGFFTRDRSDASLFVPSSEPVMVNRHVRLKATFGDCNRNFYLAGYVQSLREAGGQRIGFNLLIQTPEEQRAISHLIAFCSRNQEPAKRFATSISCTVSAGDATVRARIRDLSMTGAFVATSPSSTVKVGSTIELALKGGFLGLRTTHVPAQVIWQGEKNGTTGFGAEFLGSSSQLLELLNKHRAAH